MTALVYCSGSSISTALASVLAELEDIMTLKEEQMTREDSPRNNSQRE